MGDNVWTFVVLQSCQIPFKAVSVVVRDAQAVGASFGPT